MERNNLVEKFVKENPQNVLVKVGADWKEEKISAYRVVDNARIDILTTASFKRYDDGKAYVYISGAYCMNYHPHFGWYTEDTIPLGNFVEDQIAAKRSDVMAQKGIVDCVNLFTKEGQFYLATKCMNAGLLTSIGLE